MLNEYKKIYKDWNNFLNEAGKVLTGTEIEDMGGEYQSLTSLSSNKKVIKDIDQIRLALTKHAGPKSYITFVKAWNENDPSLSVNPTVSYNTPHGIYGYPLTRQNAQKLASTGKPTDSEFASDYDYFHIFKIKDLRTTPSLEDPEGEVVSGEDSHIVLDELGKNNYSRQNLSKDATEIFTKFLFIMSHKFDKKKTRKYIAAEKDKIIDDESLSKKQKDQKSRWVRSQNFYHGYLDANEALTAMTGDFKDNESQREIQKIYTDKFDDIEEYLKWQLGQEDLTGYNSPYSNNKIVLNDKYFSYVTAYIHTFTNQNNNESYYPAIREFMTFKGSVLVKDILKLCKTELEQSQEYGHQVTKNITAFHLLYYFAQSLSHILEEIDTTGNKSSGYFFSLFLNLVGITNIIDQGSSTIHPNEPRQSVSFSFESATDNNIEHVGTYLNIFKDIEVRSTISHEAAMQLISTIS